MIDNHLADIISNSWSYYFDPKLYGFIKADEGAFMQAAAEGISVLFAAGDYGDDLVRGTVTVAQGNYPATSPFATGMGGTPLAIYDAAGDKDEWGWGAYISPLLNSAVSADGTVVSGTTWSPWPPQFYLGSSGGISLTFLQPDYQQGVVPKSLATSTVDLNGNVITFSSPHRVTPDIAMDADVLTAAVTGETFTISGDPISDAGCITLSNSTEYCERPFGNGTSLATPMFAGVLALTNQARFAAGKGPVGFVNPTLYKLPVGRSGSGAAVYDIVPPKTPLATALNYQISPGVVQTYFFSINSVPVSTNGQVIEGADSLCEPLLVTTM